MKLNEKKKIINDYIENVNLSELEWETFEIEGLSEFIYENYKPLIEEGLDVFGFPLINFLNYILQHNSYDSRGLRVMCDDKFLLGVVNNKIGKKTIAGVIVYDEIYHDSLGACEIPVTRILGIEVNSCFQKNGIYAKMCDKFIDVVSKNRHIVMYNDDGLCSEKENDSTKRLFNKIKHAAEKKGFPNEVIYYNYIDKKEIGIPVSNTQRIK